MSTEGIPRCPGHRGVVIPGVQDTGESWPSGVQDTGELWSAGVWDTEELRKFASKKEPGVRDTRELRLSSVWDTRGVTNPGVRDTVK